VFATDIESRGCPDSLSNFDFLISQPSPIPAVEAIITNPPYSRAEKFIELALHRVPIIMMLLRLQFYESKRREKLLTRSGLVRIHAFANRIPNMHRDGWVGNKCDASRMAFAWYVWDRRCVGQPTIIDRIFWNNEDA
jgi:hypothetical protein